MKCSCPPEQKSCQPRNVFLAPPLDTMSFKPTTFRMTRLHQPFPFPPGHSGFWWCWFSPFFYLCFEQTWTWTQHINTQLMMHKQTEMVSRRFRHLQPVKIFHLCDSPLTLECKNNGQQIIYRQNINQTVDLLEPRWPPPREEVRRQFVCPSAK